MSVMVQQINPPIPTRVFDWVAWIDGSEEEGPYGFGASKKEALDDLDHNMEPIGKDSK